MHYTVPDVQPIECADAVPTTIPTAALGEPSTSRPAAPPAPTLTERGVQTSVIYGPAGEVLKVVEPVRPPFGFHQEADA